MAASVAMSMTATTIVSASMPSGTITSGTVITASVVPPGSIIPVPVSMMIVTAIGRAICVSMAMIRPIIIKRQDRNRQAQEETHTHADIAGIAGLGKKTQRQPKNCRNNEDLDVFHNLTSFLPPCS